MGDYARRALHRVSWVGRVAKKRDAVATSLFVVGLASVAALGRASLVGVVIGLLTGVVAAADPSSSFSPKPPA
jgi:hypothetical protein